MYIRKITAETMRKVQEGMPDKRQVKRGTTDTDVSEMGSTDSADRALADVAHKLANHMSVEYAVNDWNRSARDPANLAVIFVGQCR